MKTIRTKDPRVALLNIERLNCNKFHMIAELMRKVVEMKKRAAEFEEFGSARTPECLDKVMEELAYMFECEANCEVSRARLVADGEEIEVPEYFDKDGNVVEANWK